MSYVIGKLIRKMRDMLLVSFVCLIGRDPSLREPKQIVGSSLRPYMLLWGLVLTETCSIETMNLKPLDFQV